VTVGLAPQLPASEQPTVYAAALDAAHSIRDEGEQAALLGVLAQRLVRKLCTQCKVKHQPTVKEMEDLAVEYCGDSGDNTAAEAEKLVKKWRRYENLAMHRHHPKH
jgi:hypothetical protein